MKRRTFAGISVVLLISLIPLGDWAYHRDVKFFISPIVCSGKIPIRKDAYGDGIFGAKRRGKRRHKGVDIRAGIGDEVLASKGGRARGGFQKEGMGKYIIIEHPGGYSTLYGHLSAFHVKNRTRVRQGEVIGYVGKTGNARYKGIKPHLHFEIRKNGKHLDPLSFINKEVLL